MKLSVDFLCVLLLLFCSQVTSYPDSNIHFLLKDFNWFKADDKPLMQQNEVTLADEPELTRRGSLRSSDILQNRLWRN